LIVFTTIVWRGPWGYFFLWPLITASVNEWKLLRLIEKKGIVWREVS
jgi:hypothetical protein